MRVAEQMMRDPTMLNNMFQNMPGGLGGGFPGAPATEDPPSLPARDDKSEQ